MSATQRSAPYINTWSCPTAGQRAATPRRISLGSGMQHRALLTFMATGCCCCSRSLAVCLSVGQRSEAQLAASSDGDPLSLSGFAVVRLFCYDCLPQRPRRLNYLFCRHTDGWMDGVKAKATVAAVVGCRTAQRLIAR